MNLNAILSDRISGIPKRLKKVYFWKVHLLEVRNAIFFATKRARNQAPYLHAESYWHIYNWHFITKSYVD